MSLSEGMSGSHLYEKQCTCPRSCSSPGTDWSRISPRCSWAGSGTWPPGGHWGSSCRRADTVGRRVQREGLQRGRGSTVRQGYMRSVWFYYVVCTVSAVCWLTERGLGGGRPLHTCAVVGHVVVRAGAHRPAGAEQAQPFALLPVTWVSDWRREGETSGKITWRVQKTFPTLYMFHENIRHSLSGCLYRW